jgi:hypothetical protein
MTESQMQEWESLGGELISDPIAVSLGDNRMHIFCTGTDKGVWHKAFICNQWQEWESLGGELISDPIAVSLGDHLVSICWPLLEYNC